MIYHSILFSFCLIGMASAELHLCLEGNELQVKCNASKAVPSQSLQCTIKPEGSKKKEDNGCKVYLTEKGSYKITCSIGEDNFERTVDMNGGKGKIAPCSAGSVPPFAGVTLLLALLIPLLSGVL